MIYPQTSRLLSQIFERLELQSRDHVINILAVEVLRTEPGDGGPAGQFAHILVVAVVIVVVVVTDLK